MTLSLTERYQKVIDQVQQAALKREGDVTLIAVSKTHPLEKIEELYNLGQRDFGENYVQELVEKAGQLEKRGCTGIRWHFIGHLQSNKIKALVPWVDSVHSIDSLRVGEELSKRWEIAGRDGSLPVFIEVNLDRESTKSGIFPENTPKFAEALSHNPKLQLMGLMSIPKPGTRERMSGAFQSLRELEKQCRPFTQDALSMGMSDDFELAIQAGATHVRVGTALFGPRKDR